MKLKKATAVVMAKWRYRTSDVSLEEETMHTGVQDKLQSHSYIFIAVEMCEGWASAPRSPPVRSAEEED
jgi:hypothetical protein